MATSKTIAATIETERDAEDDQDRDEGLRSAAFSVKKRRTLAPSKERRDAKESGKNGRRRKSVRTSTAERACSKPVQAQGSNSWITISGSPSYSALVMTPKSSSPARRHRLIGSSLRNKVENRV